MWQQQPDVKEESLVLQMQVRQSLVGGDLSIRCVRTMSLLTESYIQLYVCGSIICDSLMVTC